MKQKMFKLILGLLIFVVVSVLAGTAFLVNYLTKSIFYGPRQSAEEAFRWQSEHYDTDFYSALEQEDFSVKSFDGCVAWHSAKESEAERPLCDSEPRTYGHALRKSQVCADLPVPRV